MSWSVSMIGTKDGIKNKLDAYGSSLTGQSKAEFDDAKPHIVGLLDQNVSTNNPDWQPLYGVTGNGHANFDGQGNKTYGSCNVKIESFGGQLAI